MQAGAWLPVEDVMTLFLLLKKPSAFIPLIMSIVAYMMIFVVLLTVGVTHPQDEGAPARIFQLLILLQIPIVASFALKWVPQNPRPAIIILILQAGMALMAVAAVIWVEGSL